MQTHTITLKARVFSDEEEAVIDYALRVFLDCNIMDDASKAVAEKLLAERRSERDSGLPRKRDA